MLTDRVRPVLEGIARDTVIVGHGGVARAALALACGVHARQVVSMDIWQGRVLVIEVGTITGRSSPPPRKTVSSSSGCGRDPSLRPRGA